MGFLKDILSDTGTLSCMRLMSLLSLFFGFGLAIFGLVKGYDIGHVSGLVGIFVGSAFAGKGLQAFAEK